MVDQQRVPRLGSVVLDSTDARALAEFYRQLLGFVYRPGDEPSADGRGLTIDTKSADRLRTSGRRPRAGPSAFVLADAGVPAAPVLVSLWTKVWCAEVLVGHTRDHAGVMS
ncbi:VOC family protein [Micromonospora sediminimaris]|uniref:VOC family protein n=1 Tax=Micromonospora sediminimaris TaxID=547162 RepID=UPI0037994F22